MKELVCHIQAEYAGKPTTAITLEMPTELLEQINRTAALEDTDAASIINCFVHQGVMDNKAAVKRLEFAEHARKVMKGQGINQDTIDEIFIKLGS